jgi:hypothetical protein
LRDDGIPDSSSYVSVHRIAPVTSNLITSNLENALLRLRFGPKSPPAVLSANQ